MQRLQRYLIRTAFLGLALRALAPVGYMPSPLDQGLPFVLCPSVGASEWLATLSHSDDSHEHGNAGAEPSGANYCPLGVALGSLAIASDPVAQAFAAAPQTTPTDSPGFQAIAVLVPYGARAPPSLQSTTS